MKKQILKTISIIIIAAMFAVPTSVHAVNNTTSNTNTSNTSTNITSTSVAGTSNANLSNLGTKKYDFTGFKPDETSYEVTIPEDVTEVEVYAKTQDSKATYKVTGDKKLKIGENKVTITVTASDGKTTKNYYINVRRLGDPSKNPVEEETTEEIQNNETTETTGKKEQSDITRYSEPHTETGWYIVGISLAIVTILLIVFIIIDDYKPEKKNKRQEKYEDIEQNNFDEPYKQSMETNEFNDDSQATKVLNLDEIKRMRSKPNTRGKHF
ncbi:MAG: cadherin-like beta sandwich domain-containing protein [Clostridia bacterium]|nr:cadherin-like beta sandwich domain-containing protein [Clostridia bacterium]